MAPRGSGLFSTSTKDFLHQHINKLNATALTWPLYKYTHRRDQSTSTPHMSRRLEPQTTPLNTSCRPPCSLLTPKHTPSTRGPFGVITHLTAWTSTNSRLPLAITLRQSGKRKLSGDITVHCKAEKQISSRTLVKIHDYLSRIGRHLCLCLSV